MEIQLLLFELAGESYGIEVVQVRSIIPKPEITVIPGAPHFIEGVINLRGEVIPVVNMCTRFGLETEEKPKKPVIIIAEVHDLQVGLIVDRVLEVTKIAETAVEPPSPLFIGIDTAYLQGIGQREDSVIILLDLDRVFSKEEHQQLSKQTA